MEISRRIKGRSTRLGFHPGTPVLRRGVPTLGSGASRACSEHGSAAVPSHSSEGPRFWLTQELTRGSNPGTEQRGARDVWRSYIVGCQLKDSHQNLGAEMLAGPTVPVAPHLPTWRLRLAPSLCSMSMASTAPPAVLSHPTPHPALTASPSHVQRLFYTSGLPQLLPRIFLKSLKGL